MTFLQCGDYQLDLRSARVMAIVNVTPDSFSDGGLNFAVDDAIAAARRFVAEGAALIDVGAESTRPGAVPVAEAEEMRRLLPVLEGLRGLGVPVSVDTYKPAVMRAALEAGASMINDVWGFRQPGAIAAVAGSPCALCVMHMQGDPLSMQANPHYEGVTAEVRRFLSDRAMVLRNAGIADARIALDPGFGFGKTVEQNFDLLRDLQQLTALSPRLLVGLSRKSMLGAVTAKDPGGRTAAGIAAALAAVARGAKIVRTHDVSATLDALKVWEMVENPAQDGHKVPAEVSVGKS